MPTSFKRQDGRCLVIAEVAQAHDGSLGTAHAYIDAVAKTGADAVKFQTHIARAESSPAEPWRVHFSYQDKTRFDYWRRMEFTREQWAGLKEHAENEGLIFLSSPFSLEAATLLDEIGIVGWKVASGEIGNRELCDFLTATQRPILLSTGMSSMAEIDGAVQRVRKCGVLFGILQCTSAYPCPPEKVGINLMRFFRERYACPAGLSDHSGTIYPGLAGAALGMDILEIHVTLSREAFGPDVRASVTTAELRQLMEGIRFIETMNAHPVSKNEIARDMRGMRELFTRSVVVNQDLKPGTVLSRAHLAARKPGTGIPADQCENLIGRKLKRDVSEGTLLSYDDLEDSSASVGASHYSSR